MQSYQVYLQHVSSVHSPQFHSSDESIIRTSSIVVRAPDSATCIDLCLLLRKKLELSCPEFFTKTEAKKTGLDPWTSQKPYRPTVLPTTDRNQTDPDQDSLVLVLTCPNRCIHFQNHEPRNLQPDRTSSYESNHLSISNGNPSFLLEPFHMVRTIKPHEFPAQIQRSMIQRFIHASSDPDPTDPNHGNPFSMDIRWYFIPSSTLNSQPGHMTPLFPTFLDLDGYCTGELSDNDCNDDKEDDFKVGPLGSNESHGPSFSKALYKNRKKSAILRNAIVSHQNECITGYLWKQSDLDPYVWRKVCCYLLDDAFWWVYRTKQYPDIENAPMGKMGSISLMGATILECCNPRVPHMFEISSSEGLVFVFRSKKRSVTMKWMDRLSSRIDECFCNNWMAMADLIIGDETMARGSSKP